MGRTVAGEQSNHQSPTTAHAASLLGLSHSSAPLFAAVQAVISAVAPIDADLSARLSAQLALVNAKARESPDADSILCEAAQSALSRALDGASFEQGEGLCCGDCHMQPSLEDDARERAVGRHDAPFAIKEDAREQGGERRDASLAIQEDAGERAGAWRDASFAVDPLKGARPKGRSCLFPPIGEGEGSSKSSRLAGGCRREASVEGGVKGNDVTSLAGAAPGGARGLMHHVLGECAEAMEARVQAGVGVHVRALLDKAEACKTQGADARGDAEKARCFWDESAHLKRAHALISRCRRARGPDLDFI